MSGKRRKTKSGGGGGVHSSSSSNNKKLKNVRLDDSDDDDEVESDEYSDDDNAYNNKQHANDSSSEEEEENVHAKRARLAKEYLKKLEDADDDSSSDEEHSDDDDGRDRLSKKLQRERLKRQGTLQRAVADRVAASVNAVSTTSLLDPAAAAQEWIDDAVGRATYLRGHDLTVTCVGLTANGETAISGSKDHSVILWDVETQKKRSYLTQSWKKADIEYSPRSNGEVLSAVCSDDGRYAIVGRRNASVQVFDIRSPTTKLVTTFTGHKGPVTSLTFRTQTHQLFSGSDDRCIRHYDLEHMTYMETLYGHQAGVTAMDCHVKERPLSVGRDRTARAWKLSEDSHLIFRGGSKVPSADCVSIVRDDWFVSGHEDSSLSLWFTEKKKAVKTIDAAHGTCGIASVGALKGSDMVATGSSDGYLRLWRVMMGLTLDDRGIEPIAKVPVHGFVNDICIGPKARFAVVAVGQEPALGRWNRVQKAKNRFGIIQLRQDDDDADDEAPEEAATTRKKSADEEEESSDDDEP